MTDGQVALTTRIGVNTTTIPHGNAEQAFKVAELVTTTGASYVTRWITYHVFPLMV